MSTNQYQQQQRAAERARRCLYEVQGEIDRLELMLPAAGDPDTAETRVLVAVAHQKARELLSILNAIETELHK